MSKTVNKNVMVITIFAVIAIIAFAALHASCHSGAYSVCLLTVCAFILASTGVYIPLSVVPFTIQVPVNNGAAIPFRLERPPRT
ncbi:MAG: hypothetical protein P1S46_04730 [bacterium]|nr:hypothetical protein [bacterium]MDT8395328.1 hypothetical protein [bacterium]